jgi:uncharacterized membrane protein YfcA
MDIATLSVGSVEVSLLGVALLGVGVGVVAGMFGVGGGFLLTPLLSVVFGIPLPIAVGTGLCQMVGTATAAFLRHRKIGQGEPRFDALFLGGSFVGIGAGTRTVSLLEKAGEMTIAGRSIPTVTIVLYASYAALLMATSFIFWSQGGRQATSVAAGLDRPRAGPLARARFGPRVAIPGVATGSVSAIMTAYLGLGLGYLSGLLGIGGGIVLMPVLIYGYGFPIKQAAGTGIVVLLATVAVGTLQHSLDGHVHLGLACVLLVGSTVSAQFGALLTRRLPAQTLRRILAGLLWVTILAIAWDVWRRLA